MSPLFFDDALLRITVDKMQQCYKLQFEGKHLTKHKF